MAGELNGTSVLVFADVSGTQTVVGSQTGATFSEADALVDVSSKAARARAVQAGRYSADVSLTHLYVPGNAAYNALKTAHRNGTAIVIERQESASALEYASCYVTSVSESFPDQGAAEISIDLAVNGVWAAGAAP